MDNNKTEPYAIIKSHQLLGGYSYMDVLRTIELPVTLIQTPGDKDINKALSKVTNRLNILPTVTIETMNKGGHVVNMELPKAYNRMVEKILRKGDRYAG